MDIEAFETAQASGAPRVRQFSVFLEDRVGQLLRLTRLFETTDVRIVGLSMVYSVDCAIIRMVVDDPDQGYELIAGSRFPVCETELLAVSIPHGRKGLLSIWTALLTAEINIRYAYPLFIRPRGHSCIVLQADELDGAHRVLMQRDFYVVDESDLRATD